MVGCCPLEVFFAMESYFLVVCSVRNFIEGAEIVSECCRFEEVWAEARDDSAERVMGDE